MADAIDDGGPAFPHDDKQGDGSYYITYSGMSLRDYFAASALTGLAAAIPGPGCADWDYYATAAYHIADAMLAARKVKT